MTDDIEDFFASLAGSDDPESPLRLPVKGITVRLDAHQRAEISALCSATDMTRQQLLEMLINSGLNTATKAYLGNSSDKENAEFAQHVHRFLLDEGVHPQLVDQISGVQIDAFNSTEG